MNNVAKPVGMLSDRQMRRGGLWDSEESIRQPAKGPQAYAFDVAQVVKLTRQQRRWLARKVVGRQGGAA